MSLITQIKKIAFLGDYLPRQCGIATFTHDLRQALAEEYPEVESFVAPVNDLPEGYDYPGEVRFEFNENDLDSYRRTADYLNFSNADVVCLQHEYGIYGGPAGSFILPLLRDLRIPVVTTLHTILQKPDADQRRVMRELSALFTLCHVRYFQFVRHRPIGSITGCHRTGVISRQTAVGTTPRLRARNTTSR